MTLPSPRTLCLALLALTPALPAAPPSADYKLVWSDEFNGPALDTNTWEYRTGERLGSWQLPENVAVVDGVCRQTMKYADVNGKRVFSSGGMISRRAFPYGYYECRSKLYGAGKGMHSSFWTMAAPTDPKGTAAPVKSTVLEIDGYEVDSDNPTHIAPNIHYYIGTHKSTGATIMSMPHDKIDSSADWFVSGFEWLPNEIRWYVNGRLLHVAKNPEFYAAQKIWITALGTPSWGKIDEGQLPAKSEWDYVRFYRRDLVGVNLVAGGDFEWNEGPGFEKAFTLNPQYPHSWAELGKNDMSRVAVTGDAPSGRSALRHEALAGATGAERVETWQDLGFLPAATYRLTAMVRRSPTQTLAQFTVKGAGADRVLPIPPAATAWTRVSLDGITVSGGDLRLSVVSELQPGEFLEIDQVEFAQATGSGDASLWKPHDPAKTAAPNGGQVWKTSSKFPGAKGPSLWCAVPNTTSLWFPRFTSPGRVRVSLFKIAASDNDPDMRFTIHHGGLKDEAMVDGRTEPAGWVELGVYDFTVKGEEYVSFTTGSAKRNTRLDAVKFERLGAGGDVLETRMQKEPQAFLPPAFTDASEHPHALSIGLLADRGYLPPRPSGAFEPDAPVTLGEWLLMLWRLSGFWTSSEAREAFDYFRRSMLLESLTHSPTEGDLDKALSREEAATLMVGAIRQMGKEVPLVDNHLEFLKSWLDGSSIPAKLRPTVAPLLRSGTWAAEGTRLDPGAPLARGEAAAWGRRALDRFVFSGIW